MERLSDDIRQSVLKTAPLKVCHQGSEQLIRLAERTAYSFAVPHANDYVRNLPFKKTLALAHYAIACQTHELSVSIGEAQISAFLAFIHAQYYGGSSIDSHWYTVKQLAKEHNLYVSPQAVNLYKRIRKNCREIQDNKVPVSLRLSDQLCKAASLLFHNYNAKLARAMFVLAFSFSMRVCEYTNCAKDDNLSHNVYSHAVSFTPRVSPFTYFQTRSPPSHLPQSIA